MSTTDLMMKMVSFLQRKLPRGCKLQRIHKLALAVLLPILGCLIWMMTRKPNQITYLSAHSPSLSNRTFPFMHMPAPGLDKRRIYLGTKDILHLENVLKMLLTEYPTWKTKNRISLRRQTILHTFPKAITDGIQTFLEYSKLHSSLLSLVEVQGQLSILKQRKFPTEPRRMTCNGCFKYVFKNVITPKNVCAGGDKINAVFIVTTIPKSAKERNLIRRTWGSDTNKKEHRFRVIFLFGYGWPKDQIDSLQKENKKYNDILMDDFVDNYYNLTQKVLMGYRWILRECPQTRFVIRSADDTWVDIPAIAGLLRQFGHEEAFQKHQVGHCFPAFIPHRGLDFKGYLNTFEYNKAVFPPYALGTVFFTSINLTRELVDISPNVPFIAIEDAYFGLALAELGRGCHHIKGMLGQYTTHNVPDQMGHESFIYDLFPS